MQPLAYQIGRNTCLIASIINGIMFLRNGERIGYLHYKIMQTVLNSFLRSGVDAEPEGVWLDTDKEFGDYENVMKLLESFFELRICTKRFAEVADTIRQLHFNRQVAICNVGNGDHSILLNKKSECGCWLSAFDPWWYPGVRTDNANVRFPKRKIWKNAEIRMCHLLEDPFGQYEDEYAKGTAYPMGEYENEHLVTIMKSTT